MRFSDYLGLALRSLRRSRLRSGLTISAIVIGATGVTIMLTFVTSVKNYVVDQFVQTGQIRQITVAQSRDLSFSPTGNGGGGVAPEAAPAAGGADGSASATATMTPVLEAKIAAIPHVSGVAATFRGSPGGPVIQYLGYGDKQLQVNNLQGYEPNGIIAPDLVAGRNLGPSDMSNVVTISPDYADALGFANNYAQLLGKTINLHTMPGYTGVGATLPDVLPPQSPCQPGPQQHCRGGPTSGLPALDLPAQVVGVVKGAFFNGETVYVPLSWFLGITNQAQPNDVQYAQAQQPQQSCPPPPQSCPQKNQAPPPGQQGQQCQPGSQGQPAPQCGPQGPGTVVGGWSQPDPATFVADNGGFSTFAVEVDTENNVGAVASAIDRLGVNTATGLAQLNKQKDSANVVGAILGGLGLIALGIAALGVTNTMVMSVLERTREIGLMRAMGARRSTIRRLFTFEAAALGFFGGLLGVIIGYVFVLAAKPTISNLVKSGPVSKANFSVPLWLIVVVLAGTTSIGFLSGLVPARRAARLDPVEALRYE